MPTPGSLQLVTVAAGVPTTGSGTVSTLDNIIDATNGPVAVKAASTAAAATDKALVVAISPNGQNPNGGNTPANSTPVVAADQYGAYETVPASATDQIMGATGAVGDYLAGVLVVPGTAAAGVVSIKDGNGSAISIFAGGGTTALTDLKPFMVPLGLFALAATTPGWKVTTGTNVTAIGIGKFT